MEKLKISILWSRMSGYFNACLKELAEETSDLIVVRQPANQGEAPFDEQKFDWIPKQFNAYTEFREATEAIAKQNPDILIVCGWLNKAYTQLASFYKRKKTFVVGTCDNPWNNTPKQKTAALISRFHVKKYFDNLWVPGQKATVFAKKLGFDNTQIFTGNLTCDTDEFHEVYSVRLKQKFFPKVFLYVGRYIELKGIRNLLDAYNLYTQSSNQSRWELWFSGSGPLERVISCSANVKNYRFTQPEKLPELFSRAGVLVLPSNYEPWGIVIHEATSAGLPVICTNVCGSSLELVENSVSGFIIPSGDPIALYQAMNNIASKEDEELWKLSQRSYEKSLSYSPQKWVEELINAYDRYHNN